MTVYEGCEQNRAKIFQHLDEIFKLAFYGEAEVRVTKKPGLELVYITINGKETIVNTTCNSNACVLHDIFKKLDIYSLL